MDDHGPVLLELETEVDRGTIARRLARNARRPPRPSDRWWALGIGLLAVTGWVVTGPGLLWWLGLLAAGLFLVGDLAERRAIQRELATIPSEQRRRIVAVGEGGVRVTTREGAVITSAPWREIGGVRRRAGLYLLDLDDQLVEIPAEAFPSEIARGSFEAVAARNDRPVQHG